MIKIIETKKSTVTKKISTLEVGETYKVLSSENPNLPVGETFVMCEDKDKNKLLYVFGKNKVMPAHWFTNSYELQPVNLDVSIQEVKSAD